MWRELFGFAGAAMAVINGLLALAIALLPARRSVQRLRVGVLAVVLGVVALGTTLVARYTVYVQDERQLSDRRAVRERLEALLSDGRAILVQIADPQQPLPNLQADEWAQRVEIYLRERLGEIYVARFRREANEMYGDAAVPAAKLAYWRAVRNRLVNLETTIAELPAPTRLSTVSTPRL
jgi:hypothetical protein